MKLFFDGSCGPTNPDGYACYGFVVQRENEKDYQESGIICQGVGASNNVAEYGGLVRGLEYISQSQYSGYLEIYGDSQLVVNQVNGEWKCKKAHLQEFLDHVHHLLENFDHWSLTWISRNENSIADGLSKWQTVLKEQQNAN